MPLARFTVMIINSPRANNQLEMRLNFSKITTIYKCYTHLSRFTANDFHHNFLFKKSINGNIKVLGPTI